MELAQDRAEGGTNAAKWLRRRHWFLDFLVRLIREKPLGTVGGLLVLVMVLMAVFADLIAPYPYDEMHLADKLFPQFTAEYILGADTLGRDILSRVIYGARISMHVGLGAVAISTTIATIIGLVSGYFGGKVDAVIQRFIDALMSFPLLVILISIMSVLGSGLVNVIIALGLMMSFGNSRVIRGAVMSVRENQYIEAAESCGCGHHRIIVRHILPNVMAPIIVLATVGLGSAVLAEASISFLGFGVPPPAPSWGGMLSGVSRSYLNQAPWMAFWPGLALSLAVFGFNMLGDAIRDLLDPRLRGAGGRIV